MKRKKVKFFITKGHKAEKHSGCCGNGTEKGPETRVNLQTMIRQEVLAEAVQNSLD